uniref:Wsv079-like protein n=1 Tax=Sesarmops intermedium nimavirus TaxID=2133796 RepID=A0A401IPS6_9VIRU|nr:MAG: wsv079-like protein [Sesarmops intermedium nimavirus]GBG35607.1 wsv079-like protein [Sesarmops intermedium nimavirus]
MAGYVADEKKMPICTVCLEDYDTEKDAYNWIPGGLPCCAQSVHLDCFSRWRFNNRNEDGKYVTTCHVCKTYVPAVWFFDQMYKAVKSYVHYEAALEEIADEEEGLMALKELWDQVPAFFIKQRREPFVSVQAFLRNEKAKFENFTIRSERTEKRENGIGVFVISYMHARQHKFKGIPLLTTRETTGGDELPNGPPVADEDYDINDEELDWCVREWGSKGRRRGRRLNNVCKKSAESLLSIVIYTCNALL